MICGIPIFASKILNNSNSAAGETYFNPMRKPWDLNPDIEVVIPLLGSRCQAALAISNLVGPYLAEYGDMTGGGNAAYVLVGPQPRLICLCNAG